MSPLSPARRPFAAMISRMDEAEQAVSAAERQRLRQVARLVAKEHGIVNAGDVAAAMVDAILAEQMAEAEAAAEERERRADEDTSVAVSLLRAMLGKNEDELYWHVTPRGVLAVDGQLQLNGEQVALVLRLGS